MKIYIAADHAGFTYKEALKNKLQNLNLIDLGPENEDRVDYPDYAGALCEKILQDVEHSKGILICGSGQGMAMKANKYKEIRAALCWSEEVTKLARQHNDANVIVLGSRVQSLEECEKLIRIFFTTDFEGGRHLDRVRKISQ